MRRRGFFWAVFLLIIYFTAPFWGWRHIGFAPITVPDTTPAPSPTAEPAASQPYHAVWVSYLEWQQVDFSSAQAFSADIAAMFDNIADLGATVVLVQVRPFGDALSAIFAPAPRGKAPALTPWPCWCRRPTPAACSWKPGSTPTGCKAAACLYCVPKVPPCSTRSGPKPPPPAYT